MKELIFSILLAPVVLTSCAQRGPEAYGISEDAFVTLYSELRIAQEEGLLAGRDSLQILHTTDSLYVAFHITSEQTAAILDDYRSSLSEWKHFHEKVMQKLEILQVRKEGK